MSTQLSALRELYSRQPEAFYLEPWELQSLLWSLGYTEDLSDEAEIAQPSRWRVGTGHSGGRRERETL